MCDIRSSYLRLEEIEEDSHHRIDASLQKRNFFLHTFVHSSE